MRRCGHRYASKASAERAAIRKAERGTRKGSWHLEDRCPCKGFHLRFEKAARETGPSARVRGMVLARDNWQCAGCGKPAGGAFTWWSLQHRKARGQGGDNSPCNLVTLCGSATSEGCHRLCEDRDREAHERGLWLRSDEDPAMVPVMVFSEHGSGVTAWPTIDGRWVTEAPARSPALP